MNSQRVLVVGAGFVGLTTSCIIANRGFNVTLVEVNSKRISLLREGKIPFYEPGLEDLFHLQVKQDRLEIKTWSEISGEYYSTAIICVPTPSLEDGSIDLGFVYTAVESSKPLVTRDGFIVIRSTILPGSSDKILEKFDLEALDINLAVVPEFLREGSALSDAINADRIVVGTEYTHDLSTLRQIFESHNSPFIVTTRYSAECAKYISNTFLSMCISFTNEMFQIFSHSPNLDIKGVLNSWHADRRFNSVETKPASIVSYLRPGIGYGGSCLPKDTSALNNLFREISNQPSILEHVINVNDRTANKIAEWLRNCIIPDSPVLFLGVAFKEGTDDLRNSPVIILMKHLVDSGFDVLWFDEFVKDRVDIPGCYVNVVPANTEQFVLTNNETIYRELLMKYSLEAEKFLKPKVFAVRFQEKIDRFQWVFPFDERHSGV